MTITRAQLRSLQPLDMEQLGAFEPVVPSDTTNLDLPAIGLNVATAGNVRIRDLRDEDVTIYCVAGWNPAPCKRVWATGTTATGIVAVY